MSGHKRKTSTLDKLTLLDLRRSKLTHVFEVLRKTALDDIEEIDVLKQSVSATLETLKTIDTYHLRLPRLHITAISFSRITIGDYTRLGVQQTPCVAAEKLMAELNKRLAENELLCLKL